MRLKPANLREKASQDVNQIIGYYLAEANEDTAPGFVDMGRHPASGSTFHAHELSWPSLKSRPLKRYPYLVFYMEQMESIDVIRVLHNQRDIPRWMLKI